MPVFLDKFTFVTCKLWRTETLESIPIVAAKKIIGLSDSASDNNIEILLKLPNLQILKTHEDITNPPVMEPLRKNLITELDSEIYLPELFTFTNVEVLHLNSSNETTNILSELTMSPLTKLKKITMLDILAWLTQCELFNNAPNLEELVYESGMEDGDENETRSPPLSLSRVSKLRLNTFGNAALDAVLASVNSLRELKLGFYGHTNEQLNILLARIEKNPHIADQLEVLELSNATLDDKQLTKLLDHAKNLKSLTLIKCKLATYLNDMTTGYSNLSQLNSLHIVECEDFNNGHLLELKLIGKILYSSTSITDLTLSGSCDTEILGSLAKIHFKFKNLKKATIDVHLKWEGLGNLLANTPNLISLEVGSRTFFPLEEQLAKLQPLTKMRYFSFTRYSFKPGQGYNELFGEPSIAALLKFMPNLSRINYAGGARLSTLYSTYIRARHLLDPRNLATIEKLDNNLVEICKKYNLNINKFREADYGHDVGISIEADLINIIAEKYHTPEFDERFTQELKLFNYYFGNSFSSQSFSTTTAQNVPNSFFNLTNTSLTTLQFTEYFPGIEPSLYRLNATRPDLTTLVAVPPFKPSDFKEVPLPSQTITDEKIYALEQGVQTVSIQNGNEIILPSLDPAEKISSLRIVTADNTLLALENCKLRYSQRDQFYQLVLPVAGNYTIYFELAVPHAKQALPADLEHIVRFYNAFKIAQEEHKFQFNNLNEAAEFIKIMHSGRCELRALAAFADLSKKYGDRVKIVRNDVHAFVEVTIDGVCHQLDLGGYPAKLTKKTMPKFELIEETKTDVTTATDTVAINEVFSVDDIIDTLAKDFTTTDDTQPERAPEGEEIKPQQENKTTTVVTKLSGTPKLLITQSESDLQAFYQPLATKCLPADIFIAHRPEDISTKGYGMTPDGKIQQNYTHLKRWLDHRNHGILIIDIREFTASEIAQLNDILDRRIENREISSSIQILLIDKPFRQYGPDFKRRVPQQSSLPTLNSTDLLAEFDTHARGKIVTIDLYESPYWQRILIGSWQLHNAAEGNALRFSWKAGKLSTLIDQHDQPMTIVINNPPLHDTSFLTFIAELQGLRRLTLADQVVALPETIQFAQSKYFDWQHLATGVTLSTLQNEEKNVHVLSDSNVLAFVDDTRYEFAHDSNRLIAQPSLLQPNQAIDILCTPNLSKGALAEVLACAQHKHTQVNLVVPAIQTLLSDSAIHEIIKYVSVDDANKPAYASTTVEWQIHSDPYFSINNYLATHKQVSVINLSAIDAPELSRYPTATESMRTTLLQESKLVLEATVADTIQKLAAGQTILVTGVIPPSLYPVLTQVMLGKFENIPLRGKLIVMAPASQLTVIEALSGQKMKIVTATNEEKNSLIATKYANFLNNSEAKLDLSQSFATLETQILVAENKRNRLPLNTANFYHRSDHEQAEMLDEARLSEVQTALRTNPWVMLEGPTGIGKTFFLQHVLPAKQRVFTIEDWLARHPSSQNPAILIIDEANFMSELTGQGENFVERFLSLKGNPPGFLWKGQYHELTPDHKVIFAFNPATYGAGRQQTGLLHDHAITVKFDRLPDSYLRPRLINPLLNQLLKQSTDLTFISDPILKVYNWILAHSDESVLITPREIKAMVNVICNRINQDKLSHPGTITQLATEVAFIIGQQALGDNKKLLKAFNAFAPTRAVMNRHFASADYPHYQLEAYGLIQNLLQTSQQIVSPQHTDLGLGGILLEGGSGIGKTHFMEKIKQEYETTTGKTMYRISPSTPYHEKETILRQAFRENACVIAEEINTSLWPHKLLNNYLMGLDEQGKETGNRIILLATQNPSWFAGRHTEDPALRRRLIKISLDWPRFTPQLAVKLAEEKTIYSPTIATIDIAELSGDRVNEKRLLTQQIQQLAQAALEDIEMDCSVLMASLQTTKRSGWIHSSKPDIDVNGFLFAFTAFDAKITAQLKKHNITEEDGKALFYQFAFAEYFSSTPNKPLRNADEVTSIFGMIRYLTIMEKSAGLNSEKRSHIHNLVKNLPLLVSALMQKTRAEVDDLRAKTKTDYSPFLHRKCAEYIELRFDQSVTKENPQLKR